MVVNVLRGGDQIGGSIIEVISDHAKIILDAGQNLEEKAPPEVPEIEVDKDFKTRNMAAHITIGYKF